MAAVITIAAERGRTQGARPFRPFASPATAAASGGRQVADGRRSMCSRRSPLCSAVPFPKFVQKAGAIAAALRTCPTFLRSALHAWALPHPEDGADVHGRLATAAHSLHIGSRFRRAGAAWQDSCARPGRRPPPRSPARRLPHARPSDLGLHRALHARVAQHGHNTGDVTTPWPWQLELASRGPARTLA